MPRSVLAGALLALALVVPSNAEAQAPLNTWCLGGAPVCFDAFAFQWNENFDPGDPFSTTWDFSMTGRFTGGPLPSVPNGSNYLWRYTFDMVGWDGLRYRYSSELSPFVMGTTTTSNGWGHASDLRFSPDASGLVSTEKADQPVTIADLIGIEIRQNDATGLPNALTASCGPNGPACVPVRVPEPASLPLLLGAGVFLLLRARKRPTPLID